MAKAKKELASRDEQITKLKSQIKTFIAEKSQLKEKHRGEIEQLRNGYQKEIDKAIHMAEKADRQSKEKDSIIDKLNLRIDQLDRKANPQRYSLSSGAKLIHHFIPNYNNPSLHIWTQVGNEKYDTIKYVDWLNPIWESFTKDEATIYELINDVFEPQEQVNEAQANLLGVAFELATGGQAQGHVGTGSGGSSSELPWGEQKTKNSQRRR